MFDRELKIDNFITSDAVKTYLELRLRIHTFQSLDDLINTVKKEKSFAQVASSLNYELMEREIKLYSLVEWKDYDRFRWDLIVSLVGEWNDLKSKSKTEIQSIWEMAFYNMPWAMALFTTQGELVLHNNSFNKLLLLPKDCLKLKDQHRVEVNGKFYRVISRDIFAGSVECFLLIFKESQVAPETQKDKKTSEELGIVTSSVAHDLNNPLAGILAAISLLKILEEWGESELNEIEELRKSTQRAKDLVGVFLGFSRFRPKEADYVSLSSLVEQALNLLRFRMIEIGSTVEFKDHQLVGSFFQGVNSSVLVMVFYLILSESLTSFSHHRLISGLDQKLSFNLIETPFEFSLQFLPKLEIKERLLGMKLLNHLIELQNLKMEIKPGEIIIKII